MRKETLELILSLALVACMGFLVLALFLDW